MSDFVDPGLNQPNEENSPSTGVSKRLLSRKYTTGVVLPKIRSRISRITKNSDLIRKNRLVLPGHTRREQYKSFGTKLLQKQSQVIRAGKLSINKITGLWDRLDLSLPNGAPQDSTRTNVFRPGLGDPGIPSGGQVIPPFSPPEINNEPSFIERRQERLKNQETKKVKPTPTKPERPTRLYSRVEEILPSSREKPASPQHQVENQIKPEDKKPSTNQTSAPKQKPSDQKVENRASQIKKSDMDQRLDSVRDDNVVQRQLANEPIIAQNPEQKKSIPDQLPELDVQKGELSNHASPTMDDELKTLAIKSSIPSSKTDDEKNLKKKVNQKELEKSFSKSFKSDKERKIEKQQSIQPPKKLVSNGEEKKELPSSLIRVKETKPIFEKIEKKEEPSSLINKVDVISPSPEKIRREIEQERKPDNPVSSTGMVDEKDFHVDQKLELPVVGKKSINKTEEKNITEKPIKGKETVKFPDPNKKDTQSSIEEKPRLRARKSAENVIKLSRKKMSGISSRINDDKSKTKNVIPLIKKFDKKSISEKSEFSQKTPLVPTPRNVIQRQPEGSSENLPERVSFIQTGFSPDEKVNPVVQTQKTSNQTGQIEEKKVEGLKQDETDSKPQPLKIQQTPLTRKISQKFIEKKNVKTRTEGIQTVKKGAFPLVMRKLDQLQKQSDQEQSLEGSMGNQQIPDQIKVDNFSLKQRTNKKSTNKNSIAEKILVTQPGKIAIENSLQKNKTGDLSPSNEPLSEKFSTHSGMQILDQNPNSAGFSKLKKSSKIQKESKEEKTIKRLQKSRSLPERVVTPKKIKEYSPRSKEELPVVQMKKTSSFEQTFQPAVAVQGPVVQRTYAESEVEDLFQTGSEAEVKLDLSKLAREVYPIIKRWIAVEKERTSGRLY